jgi:ankyrin repeat protein
MVEKLRDIGADLNAVTLNGFVPLHYAALGNQSTIIHKLADLGTM